MTNRDRYKRAFSTLHVSPDFEVEVTTMKRKTIRLNRIAALAAAMILLIGTMSVAYAADVGGIQATVRILMHGSAEYATLTKISDLEYQLTTYEGDSSRTMGMGGVEIEADGTETPISGEDLVNDRNEHGEIEVNEEGRIMLYFYDQAVDITDRYDEDGKCRITLTHDGKEAAFVIEQPNEIGGVAYSCTYDE